MNVLPDHRLIDGKVVKSRILTQVNAYTKLQGNMPRLVSICI